MDLNYCNFLNKKTNNNKNLYTYVNSKLDGIILNGSNTKSKYPINKNKSNCNINNKSSKPIKCENCENYKNMISILNEKLNNKTEINILNKKINDTLRDYTELLNINKELNIANNKLTEKINYLFNTNSKYLKIIKDNKLDNEPNPKDLKGSFYYKIIYQQANIIEENIKNIVGNKLDNEYDRIEDTINSDTLNNFYNNIRPNNFINNKKYSLNIFNNFNK